MNEPRLSPLLTTHMTGPLATVAAYGRTCITIAAAVLGSALASSCSHAGAEGTLTDACSAVGVCDPPALAPINVTVLCDRSAGAPCTESTLADQLDQLLPFVVDRPGSTLDLWVLGRSSASTRRVARETPPLPPEDATARALANNRRRFVTEARERLLAAAQAHFAARPVRRSPLFEAIAKVALAATARSQRWFVVLSDAREVSSFGDFECGPIPGPRRLDALLQRRGVLPPDALAGVKVSFAFIDGGEVAEGRCAIDLGRERRIRDLWARTLARSSASGVRFNNGPAPVTDLDNDDQGGSPP